MQFRHGQVDAGISILSDAAGLSSVASTADSTTGVFTPEELSGVNVEVLDEIDLAIVTGDLAQIQSLMAASNNANSPILTIEPEEIYYLADNNFSKINQAKSSTTGIGYLDYLRGYRDAVNNLVDNLINDSSGQGAAIAAAIDESTNTWGLQLTNVIGSGFSGKGIKIAILDTGVDFTHPDIAGRAIVSESFVQLTTRAPFLPVQDLLTRQ